MKTSEAKQMIWEDLKAKKIPAHRRREAISEYFSAHEGQTFFTLAEVKLYLEAVKS
jgi:hypothetical protein